MIGEMALQLEREMHENLYACRMPIHCSEQTKCPSTFWHFGFQNVWTALDIHTWLELNR